MSCHKSEGFISKKVFVSGQESAINLEDYKKVGFLPKGGTAGQVIVKCSNRDYHVDWADGLLELSIENMLFVAENGNDLTGTRTRLDLPFLTIRAAMLSAQTGDTVYVYAGTYSHASGALMVPGVNLYLTPGTFVSVSSPSDSTLSIGGTQGIYGRGIIAFTSVSGVTIVPGITPSNSYSNFRMEGVNFILNNVNIQWEILNNLSISFDEIRIIGGNLLDYDGSSTADGKGNVSLTAGEVTIGADLDTINIIRLANLISTNVDINIGNFSISMVPEDIGVVSMENNASTSSINIKINNVTTTIITQPEAETAFLVNNNCEAYKQIELSNIYMANPIWGVGFNAPTNIERGKIKVSGTIIDLPSGNLYSWINLNKAKQELVFELDLIDATTTAFGGALATSSLLNLSSIEGRQIITGTIRTSRADALDALMVYGEYAGGPLDKTAILQNFTIATTVGTVPFSLRKINGVSVAEVPCKGAYTNCAIDGVTNGGAVTTLDTLTVDAVNVI